MHRSGTSLAGQLFYMAGVDMGPPATFYRADRWNPDGYYEQTDIIELNKQLLHGPFWKFVYFRLPSRQTIERRAKKRAAVIQELGRKYEGKTVKDPRFSLTLPAWIETGTTVDRLLFCIRDPGQVAQSIKRRNHVIARYGLHLWYIHNKALSECVGDIPVWYLYYGNIMNQETSSKELRHAFRFFDCEMDEDRLTALAAQCVKPRLQNHTTISSHYPDHIQRLWDDLRTRHAAQFEE